MIRTPFKILLALLLSASVACEDSQLATAATARTQPVNDVAVAIPEATRQVLAQAQVIAGTLRDRSVREALFRELQWSNRAEHKLDYARYLGKYRTRILSASRPDDRHPNALEYTSMRRLDIYVPVRAHRRTWRGDANVMVAVQLDEKDPIVAVTTDGRLLILDPTAVPEIPVIAITSFEGERILGESRSRLAMDIGDEAELPECAATIEECNYYEDGSGDEIPTDDHDGDGVPNSAPEGVYLTYSHIFDLGEPWIRGEPEIEVHVLGPRSTATHGELTHVSCSGKAARGWKQFDQQEHEWNGAALILSELDLSAHGLVHPDSSNYFRIIVVEDDQGGCDLMIDPLRMLGAWGLLGATFALGIDNYVDRCSNAPSPQQCLWTFVGGSALFPGPWILWQLIHTNDDFLGAAAPVLPPINPVAQSNQMLVWPEPAMVNGGLKLIYHRYGW